MLQSISTITRVSLPAHPLSHYPQTSLWIPSSGSGHSLKGAGLPVLWCPLKPGCPVPISTEVHPREAEWCGFFSRLCCVSLLRAGFSLWACCSVLVLGLGGAGCGHQGILLLGLAHGHPFCSQGRQEGAEIDPWEDADFTLYKVTDRFGFLQ